MAKRKFKWLVEIKVDPRWVEDGFDLSGRAGADRLKECLREGWLSSAWSCEVSVRTIESPPKAEIRKAQGYVS